jgi:hypothetical protein
LTRKKQNLYISDTLGFYTPLKKVSEYYNGVQAYDVKKGEWNKTESKALIFGPMFYLEKNTILSFIYTLQEGKRTIALWCKLNLFTETVINSGRDFLL